MAINREYMKEYQYKIPSGLDYMAAWYPNVSWSQASDLYAIAVQAVLTIFNVELLIDIPYGKGLFMAKKMFKDFLQQVEKEQQ